MRIDPPRWVLGCVLAGIASALVMGGGRLLTLGGSAYYLVFGLSVAVCGYLVARGDRRGIWLYGAALFGTLLWSLWERGLAIWAVQARLAAPALLGIWVFWPQLRRRSVHWSAVALVGALGAFGIYFVATDHIGSMPVGSSAPPHSGGRADWLHVGNDLGGTRFSPLTQINAGNVSQLEPAWIYRTGVQNPHLGFEATPLMVGDTLYLCTPTNIIIALDAETGQRRWVLDPKVDAPAAATCRGVAYYHVDGGSDLCTERIIFATTDARLMAADAATGTPCPAFGTNGSVDLKRGMGDVKKGYYYVSSAPTIVRGNVVVGGWVMDGQYVGEPSGVIRAFDAVSGQLAWAWDMDRPTLHGEPPPNQPYSRGTPNSWAPMSGDEALGLVYVPTGNSTPDYWGADRSPASEKYSSSVVALDARTGELRWAFQTTHHDLWDYDVASQPTLIDLPIGDELVPALIQPTKRGQLFLLDRRTGQAVAQVEEKPAPQGAAPGDYLSPTQPFSTGMPAFDNTILSEQSMWGLTPFDQLWCRIKFRAARYDGLMTPPGLRPTVTYPGTAGGINWGSVSVDPERRLLVVNWNRMPNYNRLVPRAEADAMGIGPSTDGSLHFGLPMAQMGTPFAVAAGGFVSPIGVPCNEPPFGKIAVVSLDTRKVIWERALGSAVDSGPWGFVSHLPLPMGVPNLGGSLITRSGLIFISATQERSIRAFDSATGTLLWSSRLPAGGHATPMSYISRRSGRQFIVIDAGGSPVLQSRLGDYVVAYALPAKPTR